MIDCTSGKLIQIPARHYRLALHLLSRVNRTGRIRQRLYWCRECRCWHFTSRPQRVDVGEYLACGYRENNA